MPTPSRAVPSSPPQAAGRPASQITEVTRRRLIQGLAEMGTSWSGVLDDVEFLGRLYDLDSLPSTDRRYDSAGGDIFMHRVMNPMDWDEDWIFYDSRFGLADSDDALVRFLAEMLHPVVRTDLAVAEEADNGFRCRGADASGVPDTGPRLLVLSSSLSRWNWCRHCSCRLPNDGNHLCLDAGPGWPTQ